MYTIERSAFISDLHFNHYYINKAGEPRGVTLFERKQFKSIEDHDWYIISHLTDWATKHRKWNLFVLGDFGDLTQVENLIHYLHKYDVYVIGVHGNHESKYADSVLSDVLDEYHRYPYWVTKRVFVSHEPKYPCPVGNLNIHGHLHGMKLDDKSFMCVSAHVINYQPVSWKAVSKRLQGTPQENHMFLKEPYADKFVLTQPNPNAVAINGKRSGKIDLEKSLKLNYGDNNESQLRNTRL